MALEGGQLIRGVGPVESAGVDEAHEEIPDAGSVLGWNRWSRNVVSDRYSTVELGNGLRQE